MLKISRNCRNNPNSCCDVFESPTIWRYKRNTTYTIEYFGVEIKYEDKSCTTKTCCTGCLATYCRELFECKRTGLQFAVRDLIFDRLLLLLEPDIFNHSLTES